MTMTTKGRDFFEEWSAHIYAEFATDQNTDPITPNSIYVLRCKALYPERQFLYGIVEGSRHITSEMLDAYIPLLGDSTSHAAVLRLWAEEIDEEITRRLDVLPATRIWLFEKCAWPYTTRVDISTRLE